MGKERYESDIERKNFRVSAKIGNKAYIFAQDDTQLSEFPARFAQFEHVFHRKDDGDVMMLTRDQFSELWESLEMLEFPREYKPYPSLTEEMAIMGLRASMLMDDIESFEETGEIE